MARTLQTDTVRGVINGPEGRLSKGIDMVARTVVVLLVALTVFTPVAAQAACAPKACAMETGCGPSDMGQVSACCTSDAAMMSSGCVTGHEKPNVAATPTSPDLAAPVAVIGVAGSLFDEPSLGRPAKVVSSPRPPGDSLTGTRLRV